jgi:hypothetical protein
MSFDIAANMGMGMYGLHHPKNENMVYISAFLIFTYIILSLSTDDINNICKC